MVPSSSVPCHALESAAAVQSVTQVAAERDGTASKVTLIADFKPKLRHPRIIAVRQLKTWKEEEVSKSGAKGYICRKIKRKVLHKITRFLLSTHLKSSLCCLLLVSHKAQLNLDLEYLYISWQYRVILDSENSWVLTIEH